MTELFAFNVAVLEPETETLGWYDEDQQQFIWAGDGEVSLGDALCTRGRSPYATCYSTGTSCVMGGHCTSTANNCYARCDYG